MQKIGDYHPLAKRSIDPGLIVRYWYQLTQLDVLRQMVKVCRLVLFNAYISRCPKGRAFGKAE